MKKTSATDVKLPEVFLAVLLFLPWEDILAGKLVSKRWRKLIDSMASLHPIQQLSKAVGAYFMADDGIYHARRTNMNAPPRKMPFKYDPAVLRHALKDELTEMSCGTGSCDNHEQLIDAIVHRTHAVTVLFDRCIVRCGGRVSGREERLASCIAIDPLQRTITALPPMDKRRSAAAGVVIGLKLYVFGGFDGASELDTYEVLDLSTMEWETELEEGNTRTRLRKMPYGICEHAVVQVCNRYAVLLGGCINRGHRKEASVDIVWALDTVSGQWFRLPEMPADRILGCSFVQAAEDGSTCITYVGGAPLRRSTTARMAAVTMQFFFRDADLTKGTWSSRAVGGAHRELNTVCIQRAMRTGPAEMVSQGCVMSLASPSAHRWEVESRCLMRCFVSGAVVLE